MRSLSASDILRIWEYGQDKHPIDGALDLLMVALPEMAWADLAILPVGRRDAALFALREQCFGRTLVGRASCPVCSTNVEIPVDLANFRLEPPKPMDVLETDGYTLKFRLPHSRDMAAVARSGGRSEGLTVLLGRCLLDAQKDGLPTAPEELPVSVIDQLAEAMAEQDPLGEVLLDVVCSNCKHTWQRLLDIVSILRTELFAEAARLFGEVDALARAYGWSEIDILAMSRKRRQRYLAQVCA